MGPDRFRKSIGIRGACRGASSLCCQRHARPRPGHQPASRRWAPRPSPSRSAPAASALLAHGAGAPHAATARPRRPATAPPSRSPALRALVDRIRGAALGHPRGHRALDRAAARAPRLPRPGRRPAAARAAGPRPCSIFASWLRRGRRRRLARALEALRVDGRAFDLPLQAARRPADPRLRLGARRRRGAAPPPGSRRRRDRAAAAPATDGHARTMLDGAARAGLPARRQRPAGLCQCRLSRRWPGALGQAQQRRRSRPNCSTAAARKRRAATPASPSRS